MDRIGSVAVFIEVAERRSFAAAARRLGRSPTAVTRAISELEARLGVRLLNRTTRAVGVTEAGLSYGLTRVGVPSESAFAIALAYRIATFYLPPIWGYPCFSWLSKRRYI